MKLHRIRNNRNRFHWLSGLWFQNPVLVLGLALPFAIGATFSLRNGVALSVALFLTTVPTLVAASFMERVLPAPIRLVVNLLVATACMSGARYLIRQLFPDVLGTLGVYFSILAFNTILLIRSETVASRVKPHIALLDGVVHSIGFGVVACLISLIREWLGNGTVWGISVAVPLQLNGLLLPFGGFMLVAFFSAFVRFTRRIYLRAEVARAMPRPGEAGPSNQDPAGS